jgi:hypothetical protein
MRSRTASPPAFSAQRPDPVTLLFDVRLVTQRSEKMIFGQFFHPGGTQPVSFQAREQDEEAALPPPPVTDFSLVDMLGSPHTSVNLGVDRIPVNPPLQGCQTSNPYPGSIPNNLEQRAGGVGSHAKPGTLPRLL